VNRPAGSTPGPQHEDLSTGAPSATDSLDSPDGRDGRDAETDEAQRPSAEPPGQLPDGYEPL
jgi:hypothetical protein